MLNNSGISWAVSYSSSPAYAYFGMYGLEWQRHAIAPVLQAKKQTRRKPYTTHPRLQHSDGPYLLLPLASEYFSFAYLFPSALVPPPPYLNWHLFSVILQLCLFGCWWTVCLLLYLCHFQALTFFEARDLAAFMYQDRAALIATSQLPLVVALAGKNNLISCKLFISFSEVFL